MVSVVFWNGTKLDGNKCVLAKKYCADFCVYKYLTKTSFKIRYC